MAKGNEQSVAIHPLFELALIYLRLGLTAFGGPAAHIAMMRREFVETRKWLSDEEFVDLLGAVNLIPGPNSTQMAILIGKTRAGVPGLFLAGICFILPAAILVSGCAWAYVRFGASPDAQSLMVGVKPVIIAVIVQAIWGLLRTTVKNGFIGTLGVAAVHLHRYIFFRQYVQKLWSPSKVRTSQVPCLSEQG